MIVLLGLLPVIAFGLGFLFAGNAKPAWSWDRAFLRSAVFFGAYAVLGAELLGLVDAVTLPGLVALWLAPVVLYGAMLFRAGRARRLRYPRITGLSAPEALLTIIIVLILVTTATVAYFAPPNTWDSLTYHMARVAHWAQAGSLNHFPTGIERQNLMPPGAEIGMLHAYVLAQGDRLVNFPQWLAMAASLVGAAAVARLLGASRLGQVIAAVFVGTLPMGIAQASSTMTDYVVALWVLCVAYETTCGALSDRTERPNRLSLGLAAGLAILAKPTAFAYLAPFAVVVAFIILRQSGIKALLSSTAVAAGLVLVINAGYFGRNIVTYGSPIGPEGKRETHANELLDAKVVASNVIRNASLHAGTPWREVNDIVFRGVIWLHLKMGIGLTDPRTTIHEGFQVDVPSLDEKRAGNPLHAASAVLVALYLVFQVLRGRRPARLPLLAVALAAAAFLLLSSMIKFSVFASRYHLPFFVLLAPAFGYVVGRWNGWLVAGLAGLMAVSSNTWLLSLEQRPLLPDRSGYSVVLSPRESLYFMTGHFLEPVYQDLAAAVTDADCRSLGVMLTGDAAEYPLWPLLGEPGGGTRLEWIVGGTPSAKYEDPRFHPCAVICDGSCPGEWEEVRGLPLTLDLTGYRLFLSRSP